MQNNTTFAIGCLVQWYEIDIINEYVNTLKDAVTAYDGFINIDCMIVMNQTLEKTNLPKNEFDSIKTTVISLFHDIQCTCSNALVNIDFTKSLYTIADYRREFNIKYCDIVDILIWGESDMLVPKQMFPSLDLLHQSQSKVTPRYLATFGICKMWDKSWEPLEHTEFTDKPFIENDYTNWWSLKYTMTIEEMNLFNNKIDQLDVRIISPHKYNGCGLVISSEVIKAGVNIPKSVFFVHEDTAFMLMSQKILGNIPQYHFKNILLVHNRNHPNKRNHIMGESGESLNQKRRSNNWYVNANKMSEQNCYNIFNQSYKFYTWEDVWK